MRYSSRPRGGSVPRLGSLTGPLWGGGGRRVRPDAVAAVEGRHGSRRGREVDLSTCSPPGRPPRLRRRAADPEVCRPTSPEFATLGRPSCAAGAGRRGRRGRARPLASRRRPPAGPEPSAAGPDVKPDAQPARRGHRRVGQRVPARCRPREAAHAAVRRCGRHLAVRSCTGCPRNPGGCSPSPTPSGQLEALDR